MNLQEFISTFPRGGGYSWDPKNPTDGVSRDLIYQGQVLLRKDPNGLYCCGITFQGWFECIGHLLQIPFKEMRQIQKTWYIDVGEVEDVTACRGPVDALVPRGLAVEIAPADIKPGDLGQVWWVSGGGHGLFPLSIDSKTLRYFSSQKRITNGPGERTASLVNISKMYFCRPL